MADALVDTSLLVDYLRASPHARAFFASLRATGVLRTHLACVAELHSGVKTRRDAREVDRLVAAFEVEVPDEADLRRSVVLLARLRPSHGIEWNDCLIGATALRLGFAVATRNDKHFGAIAGLRVSRPY
ncbi:MAG: PIN domain-containing protein [Phycisphaerales bacterium]